MHLESKFWASYELFETEESKIVYIRDHCKDVAFDCIKARANMANQDHYTRAEDVIQDLENMFGEFDKESKAEAELQNPKFHMGAKDPKETFDQFHARFTATVAPLNMSEREKVSHLKRTISQRLKNKILDYPLSSSHRELISRLRQVDMNMRLNDDQIQALRGGRGNSNTSSTRGTRGGNTTSNNSTRGSSSGRGSSRGGTRYNSGLSSHITDRLKKEGRCFRCLGRGHLPYQDDAPCKDEAQLTEKQVTARLAEVGLEQPGEAPPTYKQQLSEN